MPSQRVLTPSRLAACGTCLAAAVTLAACGGSSGSGPSHPSAIPTSQGPARDGLLQVQVIANKSLTNQVVIETSDGVAVKTVTLPSNTAAGQVVGPGRVLYSPTSPFTLVNADGTTKTITAPDSDYAIESFIALGPYPARYLPLSSISGHPFLLDTVAGTTVDLSTAGASVVVSAIFNSPDGRAVLVQGDRGAAVLQPSKPGSAHRFADTALAGGFTSDGQAIVAEPFDKSHQRVVSFNVDTGKETQIANVATMGPATAVPVGNTIAFASRSSLELLPLGGGSPRTVSTDGADVARVTPVADGRHALVYTGSQDSLGVSLLDTATGDLMKLPALTGTVPKLSNGQQRYLLFAAGGDNPAPSGNTYGLDAYTGHVTTFKLPMTVGASSSIDGRVRTVQPITAGVVSNILDLSTGSMATIQGTASVSPSGSQLVVRNGRNPLVVTDLKGKRTATLQPGFAVWTPA